MKYRVTYRRGGDTVDLDIAADATVTVGELAATLRRRDPVPSPERQPGRLTMVVSAPEGARFLPPEQPLVDSDLASGMTMAVRPAPERPRAANDSPAAVLTVVAGPQGGERFPLRPGVNRVGRGAAMDVRLRDPLVSREHARILVGPTVEIVDANSANGVIIDGAPVGKVELLPRDRVVLGETTVAVERIGSAATPQVTRATPTDRDAFVRPPKMSPRFSPEEHPTPRIPEAPRPQRFPIVALLTPLMLGAVLFAVTGQVVTLLFVLMSPIMMIGTWAENRWSMKRQIRRNADVLTGQMDDLRQLISQRQALELSIRNEESPSAAMVVEAIQHRTSLLWSHGQDHPDRLCLRLGLGRAPSRVSVRLPYSESADTQLWRRFLALRDELAHVENAPIVADLRTCGSVGVAGAGRDDVARALVMQAAGLQAPAALAIAACLGAESAPGWDWLKWLPHTGTNQTPVEAGLLTNGPASGLALVAALEDLVATRTAALRGRQAEPGQAVLLIVESDCPVDPARLVGLAETGPSVGVHVLWSAPQLQMIPAACRAYVIAGTDSQAGFVAEGRTVSPLVVDRLTLATVTEAARALAPVTDTGARSYDVTDLPGAISYLSLAGPELAEDASVVLERWVTTDSLAAQRPPGVRRAPGSLRALIGQGATGPLAVDLRTQGPHALVGGTTGSGKSELLQTWVLGLAAAYSPERVTFLFVDYKGGSAFGECVMLPHSVGLVTDLSPHLVRRALTSLNAELRHRERILNAVKAKDLESMERQGHRDTPPSLVIVVDEFAALAHDVPEFVDGVVNVAQRGRSLGLHLILATQRPAGVIKDNLRANTNLRLALRMADEADSTDVLGTEVAAHFDPAAPGRAAVRSGPNRLTPFQAGYVGGHTSATPIAAELKIVELGSGATREWEEPDAAPPASVQPEGPTDLERIVATINRAASVATLPPPRRPWLPELPAEIELATLIRDAPPGQLIFALGDEPERQAQPLVAFQPDVDGHMVVIGTGGSGKSAVLRSIAVAAAADPGGPSHVYAIDFGSRGLDVLERLPHVGSVISGDDAERVIRVLRELRATIDERAKRFAAAQSDTLAEYRAATGRTDDARLILLVDGLATFRQAYDSAVPGNGFELLAGIAADGRSCGVHLVLTADRVAAIPSGLGSMIPRRLVLRTADDNDLAVMGAPRDLFTLQSPAGRGWWDGHEVQAAVLGRRASVAVQGRAIEELAAELRSRPAFVPAPPVRRLSDRIALDSLPPLVHGRPVLGVEDQTLGPVAIPASGTFVVTGPPGSGRTTAVTTIARSVRRARPAAKLVLLSPARSDLSGVTQWFATAIGPDQVADTARDLQPSMSDDPAGTWLILLVDAADFLNGPADLPLQDLVRAARSNGQMVVAEGDTQSMAGSWPLQQALRFSRRGLALQPDQSDGDLIFRTSFPRLRRADFPQGRGLLVGEGRTARVQVAIS